MWRKLAIVCGASCGLMGVVMLASSVDSQQPVVGTHDGHVMGASGGEAIRIAQVVRGPDHFVGNVIRDAETGRVWLLSYGPPANTVGKSTLYEIEPATGRVLWTKPMPFQGEFGSATYVNGFLYQPIAHESTMYKVAATADAGAEGIVGSVKLPTHLDLPRRDDDVYRFPYIAFTAAAPAGDGHVLLYAADLGELITIDQQTGAVLQRIRTSKGLAGITRVPDINGRPLLLGTFDPVDSAFRQETRRYMFRASHGILPLETVRAEGNYGTPGQKTVTWVLLDPDTGEVLAATAIESSRIAVGSVALVKRLPASNARYGTLVVLTTGEEGILTVEWTPR